MNMSRQFSSELSQLAGVREFTRQICQAIEADTTQALVSELQLVINEVFSNIVIHGYCGEAGRKVKVEYHCEHDCLDLVVSDQGKSFDPMTKEDPDLDIPNEGGMGLCMIKTIMDDINYTSKDLNNGWNVLKLTKKI